MATAVVAGCGLSYAVVSIIWDPRAAESHIYVLALCGLFTGQSLVVPLDFQNGVNLLNKVATEQQRQQQGHHHHPEAAAEAPQPLLPPLLLIPRSPMSELRRLRMPFSPVPFSPAHKAAASSSPSSTSSSNVSSPRNVSEDQKPRPTVEPDNESNSAYSIV
ncbi:hypothetical protein ABZP36_012440 [Zizania latifolia]